MSSSSDRLGQMLSPYRPPSPQYPNIKELTQLLSDVTHDEKVEILKRHYTMPTAGCNGHTEIITTVLSSVPQQQRLDVCMYDQATPFHWAASFGRSDSVKTILVHLSPEQQLKILTLRDDCGKTPADYASLRGYKETNRLLTDYQRRAEKQIADAKDKDKKLALLTREVQTLRHTSAELANSNNNKEEVLRKATKEIEELKLNVSCLQRKRKEEVAKLTKQINDQQSQLTVQQKQLTQQKLQNDELQRTVDRLTGQLYTYSSSALILYSRVGREDGAVKEADMLESGFRTQGSHVTRHEWITVSDLQYKLQTSIQAVSSACQTMFVCVMSHGGPGVLCGADGIKLPLNDLLNQLNALPATLPLVVLVQACQSTNMEYFDPSVELDAEHQVTDASRASPPESSICPHIDLTRPHTVLLRSTVTNGYSRRGAYTEALAYQIGSADGIKSIHEMHEDAVKAMRSKFGVEYMEEISQVPEYRDTLQGEKLVLKKAAIQ